MSRGPYRAVAIEVDSRFIDNAQVTVSNDKDGLAWGGGVKESRLYRRAPSRDQSYIAHPTECLNERSTIE